MDVETLVSVIGLLLGGGGIGTFFTWKYTKRKEKAEAETAEVNAAKEVQDVYQQLIDDVKRDRNEQKEYISELKDDRRHLREERDELRDRIDKTDEMVRNLQREVARNGRQIELMRPFLCYDQKCKKRQLGVISEGEATEARQKDIEPLAMKDL